MQTAANIALRAALKSAKRPNKYGAVRKSVDGYKFDSTKEARRYGELKLLERAGKICSLEIHPVYALAVSGQVIGNAEFDFRYIENGATVIEDCKGGSATNTPLSKWKRKHFEFQSGYKVRLR